jgi:C4-dicarboxylate transporter/malic acid transport protein
MFHLTVSADPRIVSRLRLRETVRQFTPNWFAATMGTGILALALNQFPVSLPGLPEIARSLWLLNIGLFALFSALYAARWVFFFAEAKRVFGHSTVSMFFGAIPMGLATILNGFLVFGIELWGPAAMQVAHALWWFDAALSVLCGVAIPFAMFTRQDHSIEKMTAIWLMPIVAAEVAAASGGLLVPHLAGAEAFRILILSYAVWAFSVPLAMGILTILLLRLAVHKLPHRDMAASGWLALGPIGTGALGLLLLGADAPAALAGASLPDVGPIAFGQFASGLGVIGGTMLWGYGVWWLLLAVLTTRRYLREGIPFNIGWWGFIFPLGVYAVATLALARATHLDFLLAISGVLIACLASLWIVVAARTLHGAWRGTLFVSPCLVTGSIPADFAAGID